MGRLGSWDTLSGFVPYSRRAVFSPVRHMAGSAHGGPWPVLSTQCMWSAFCSSSGKYPEGILFFIRPSDYLIRRPSGLNRSSEVQTFPYFLSSDSPVTT